MEADGSDAARLVALLRQRPEGTSSTDVTTALAEYGTLQAAEDALLAPVLFDEHAEAIRAHASADVAGWRSRGIGVHALTDPSYPLQLREVVQAPPVVFTRGRVEPGEAAVAVVGSRRASGEAVEWASHLARVLVDRDVAVASGLAEGVDAAVHRAVLEAGGRTVAVLGTGVDRCYPAGHRALQDEVAACGLLLSQFWPDATPTKRTFPMRNATMSGYSRATVVVEAGEASGARIQARVGIEHGRQVLLTDRVVDATRWGAKLAARPGVHVVSTVDDAVDKLGKILRLYDADHGEVMDDLTP